MFDAIMTAQGKPGSSHEGDLYRNLGPCILGLVGMTSLHEGSHGSVYVQSLQGQTGAVGLVAGDTPVQSLDGY